MIISVSRRTDIPAFYSDWFFNRLEEGFVYVKNPMNINQIRKISLKKEDVDCFVFWTKNAIPLTTEENLIKLKDYKYYFQYTISPYGKDVEPCVIDKKKIIENFIFLAKTIGKEKMVFRYDPIFLSEKYNLDYHFRAFERLCEKLGNYTEKCVISFVDLYKKTERNTKSLRIRVPNEDEKIEIVKKFVKIANKYNMVIETCSENGDFSKYGVQKGKCIDDRLISKILGINVYDKKDKFQREECGCIKSYDIGEYNTCIHGCLYCYANFNKEKAIENYKLHNKNSKLLIGEVGANATINEAKKESILKKEKKAQDINDNQLTLI